MGGCGRLAGIATIGAHRANVAPLWRRLLAGFGAYWRDRVKAVVDCSADMTRLSRRGRWVSAMLARIDFAQGFNWSGQRRWRRWKPGTEPGRWRGRKRPTEGAGSAESLWLSEGSDAAISFSELLELKEEKNCCLLLRPGFSRSSATCFGPAATGGGTDAPRGGELDICPQTNAPQEVSSVPQWPAPSGCGLWTSAPGSTPGPPPDRGSSPHLDQLTRPMPYRLTNWSKTRCDSWDSFLPSYALFSALRMLADAKTMLAAEPV